MSRVPRRCREWSLADCYDDLVYECQQAGIRPPWWLHRAIAAGLCWLSRMVYRIGRRRRACTAISPFWLRYGRDGRRR
jgi:hypothetical protein